MAQRRVLIVDDEENIGRSLKLILEREGYAVTVCLSVGEARAHPHRPDAYLVDVRLPDGSGIDFRTSDDGNEWRWTEQWIPHAAWFLQALTAMSSQ